MLQTTRWATAALVVSIGLPGISTAATHNIPRDFATIQACIDAAVSGVDECVVAPGTYPETINFLGKAITLRSSGGADVTTIDATGLNSSVVTCSSGEGPDTVLDGFTITGGTGGNGNTRGGGMYNNNSSPTVSNCIVSGNTAYVGGGMYNHYSSPRVTNCTFSGNTGTYSGGIYNDNSNPTVTNCAFTTNIAYYGGGMQNENSNPAVSNCMFAGNMGDYGGGMLNSDNSNPTVTKSTFGENSSRYSGGGMYNYYTSPKVANCTFRENRASYAGGGGMYNEHGSPSVTSCTFSGNTTFTCGGGMYNHFSSPTVAGCAFRGNRSSSGGAMCNDNGASTVSNCTFSANTASSRGGGMYNSNYYSSPSVTNCVFWGDSPQEILNDWSAITIRFSDVEGSSFRAEDGAGNIDLDPMFVRPPDPGPDGMWDGVDDDYGDLRLRAGSPGIDTGDPAFVAQPGETDLEGHARVLCGRVDMGAYEYGIGDYDCDQAVDLADFSRWQACMAGPLDSAAFHSTIDNRHSTIGCESFDFDGDGSVSLFDFSGFQRVFGP